MQRIVCIGLATAFLCVGSLAGTAPESPGDPYESKIKDLQNEILGLLLLRELRLEKPVLRELLTLAYHGCSISEKHQKEESAVNVEFEKACREFREEDYANKGFSRRVEGKTARLERRLILMRKGFCEKVNELEAKADALLTKEQRELIKRFPVRFDTGSLMRLLRNRPVVPEIPKPIRIELARLRRIPAGEWTVRKTEIVRAWVTRFERVRRPFADPAERARYEEQLAALVEKVRAMSDREFRGADATILTGLRPPDQVRKVHTEIREINKEKYGTIGRLGIFLCAPCTLSLLEKKLGLKSGEGKPEGVELEGDGSKAPKG
ncbi:MAG: hypothetical protein ACYS47_00595 [Planctomycetota bacterium]|jgi:hypothetical protein